MARKLSVRKGKNFVVRQLTEEPCRDLSRHLSAERKPPAHMRKENQMKGE